MAWLSRKGEKCTSSELAGRCVRQRSEFTGSGECAEPQLGRLLGIAQRTVDFSVQIRTHSRTAHPHAYLMPTRSTEANDFLSTL